MNALYCLYDIYNFVNIELARLENTVKECEHAFLINRTTDKLHAWELSIHKLDSFREFSKKLTAILDYCDDLTEK